MCILIARETQEKKESMLINHKRPAGSLSRYKKSKGEDKYEKGGIKMDWEYIDENITKIMIDVEKVLNLFTKYNKDYFGTSDDDYTLKMWKSGTLGIAKEERGEVFIIKEEENKIKVIKND